MRDLHQARERGNPEQILAYLAGVDVGQLTHQERPFSRSADTPSMPVHAWACRRPAAASMNAASPQDGSRSTSDASRIAHPDLADGGIVWQLPPVAFHIGSWLGGVGSHCES